MRPSCWTSATLLAPTLLTLSALSFAAEPGATDGAAESTASANVVRPAGLFVCRGPGPTPDREVDFPFISGWLVRPGWSAVEPQPGQYDWKYIAGEIATAARLGKRITLCVLGGPQAPDWLYGSGARGFDFTFRSYQKREGTPSRIPVLWDEPYLRAWTALIAQLGQRFGDSPAVALVHVTGATRNGLEMQLPFTAEEEALWRQLGYAPEKAIAAWKRVIDAYAAAFPRTPLDIDVHPVLGSDEVAREVTAYGFAKLGARFGVFGGWLSGFEDKDAHHAGMRALAREYGAKSFAAFQLIGNETRQPERFPPGGIKAAIEQGMGWGARYFEVWQSDAMNPQLHPTLRALAGRIAESASTSTSTK